MVDRRRKVSHKTPTHHGDTICKVPCQGHVEGPETMSQTRKAGRTTVHSPCKGYFPMSIWSNIVNPHEAGVEEVDKDAAKRIPRKGS